MAAPRASGAWRWPLPGPQDASQTALGAPKTPPGRLQDACKSAQDVSKSAQEPPRRLEDASKTPPRASKRAKERPKRVQEVPRSRPWRATEVSKCLSGGPLQNKVHHTTWPQDCPVDKACLTLQPAPRRHCLTLHMISTVTDSRSMFVRTHELIRKAFGPGRVRPCRCF